MEPASSFHPNGIKIEYCVTRWEDLRTAVSPKGGPGRVESGPMVAQESVVNEVLDSARATLQGLVQEGLITRFEGPEKEEGVFVFTAYAKEPERVEEKVWERVISLGRGRGVVILVDVEREDA